MILLLFIVLVFLLTVLQTSFFSHFEFLDSTPNLMLVFVISWCILKDCKNSLLGALLGGALLDLFSGTFFGINMLSLLVTSIAAYLIVSNFLDIDNIYSRIGIISFSTLFYYLFIFLIFFILKLFNIEFIEYFNYLWKEIIGAIILNIILIFLFYRLVIIFREFSLRYKDRIKAKT